MKITVHVRMGLVGCERKSTIDVEDDLSEDDLEEIAREEMFDMIEWWYERGDKNDDN